MADASIVPNLPLMYEASPLGRLEEEVHYGTKFRSFDVTAFVEYDFEFGQTQLMRTARIHALSLSAARLSLAHASLDSHIITIPRETVDRVEEEERQFIIGALTAVKCELPPTNNTWRKNILDTVIRSPFPYVDDESDLPPDAVESYELQLGAAFNALPPEDRAGIMQAAAASGKLLTDELMRDSNNNFLFGYIQLRQHIRNVWDTTQPVTERI